MSVESFQFTGNGVEIAIRERRPYGEKDSYSQKVLAYSEIGDLPSYEQEHERAWGKAAQEFIGGTVAETSYDDLWIPQAATHIRFASVYSSSFFAAGPGDGWEDTHGPFLVQLPPPSSVTLTTEGESYSAQLTTSLRSVHDEILEDLASGRVDLWELSPTQFEEFVASIFHNHGYKVQVTKRTRDGGIDVIAVRENPLGLDLRIIVQCKRYRPDRRVGLAVVRELWGVVNYPGARWDRGIIATSSYLSRDAQQAIETDFWRLSAMDHDDVLTFAGFAKDERGIWLPATRL